MVAGGRSRWLALERPLEQEWPHKGLAAELGWPQGGKTAGPKGSRKTAMDIFLKHTKFTTDVNGERQADVTGIISRACYVEWLESREKVLPNPEEQYRDCVASHITNRQNSGHPFPEIVERALIKLLRPMRKVWPCFQGCLTKKGRKIRIGMRGLETTGYHEARRNRAAEKEAQMQQHNTSPRNLIDPVMGNGPRVMLSNARRTSSGGSSCASYASHPSSTVSPTSAGMRVAADFATDSLHRLGRKRSLEQAHGDATRTANKFQKMNAHPNPGPGQNLETNASLLGKLLQSLGGAQGTQTQNVTSSLTSANMVNGGAGHMNASSLFPSLGGLFGSPQPTQGASKASNLASLVDVLRPSKDNGNGAFAPRIAGIPVQNLMPTLSRAEAKVPLQEQQPLQGAQQVNPTLSRDKRLLEQLVQLQQLQQSIREEMVQRSLTDILSKNQGASVPCTTNFRQTEAPRQQHWSLQML